MTQWVNDSACLCGIIGSILAWCIWLTLQYSYSYGVGHNSCDLDSIPPPEISMCHRCDQKILKKTKIKHKKRILKTAKEKQHVSYKATAIRSLVDFLTGTLQDGREWHSIFKVKIEKTTTQNTLPEKTLIQIWRRGQQFYRQGKGQKVQHHEARFTGNV